MSSQLLDEFRSRYYRFQATVDTCLVQESDPTVVQRLADDLAEFRRLLGENSNIFSGEEFGMINHNLSLMIQDVLCHYNAVYDRSHMGR
ncbi:hypothetical protein FA95DRAFT_1684221 [Auriscalpium vulgare]|uniref:Uncharacterized protein n=1 Tax=Auriscalpium vulgare TaxID=40419 RepID=A0ACB8R644_9AGAM|nr:hypothetical protein FA95DRAFT_1684221 [Auriscalpium vulgare]